MRTLALYVLIVLLLLHTDKVEAQTFDNTFEHKVGVVDDNIKIHYVIGGKGDPVLLIHGWPQLWYEWRQVMPALAENHTVIAIDMPGFGLSSKPRSGYDHKTIAGYIAQLIKQLGYDSINLVGHDMGGGVAYSLAATNQELIKKLAIVEMVVPGFGLEQAMDNSTGHGMWHLSFLAEPDLPVTLITGKEDVFFPWFYKKFAHNPAAFDKEDIDYYIAAFSASGALNATLQYYQNFFVDAEQNKVLALNKLKMPVLAIGGEYIMRDAPLQSLRQVAVNVTGGIIPDCGHWVAEEQPEFLASTLKEFFSTKNYQYPANPKID